MAEDGLDPATKRRVRRQGLVLRCNAARRHLARALFSLETGLFVLHRHWEGTQRGRVGDMKNLHSSLAALGNAVQRAGSASSSGDALNAALIAAEAQLLPPVSKRTMLFLQTMTAHVARWA